MNKRGTLIAIGGFSGSGKSTQCRILSQKFNALWLRSDAIRKELWGVPASQKLPPAAYSRENSDKVTAELNRRLNKALQHNQIIIVDALFTSPSSRARVERMAHSASAAFFGFWLAADLASLRARVNARQNDASDADEAVLNRQLHYDIGTVKWHRINANGTPAQTQKQIDHILTWRRTPAPGGSIPKP